MVLVLGVLRQDLLLFVEGHQFPHYLVLWLPEPLLPLLWLLRHPWLLWLPEPPQLLELSSALPQVVLFLELPWLPEPLVPLPLARIKSFFTWLNFLL